MKKVSALLASFTTYLVLANPVFAATTINPCPTESGDNNFSSLCKLTLNGTLFSSVITLAFIAASLIALAFLIFGGIRWITSGGDKAGVESARNIIIAALIGLVITFLAYLIITIVFQFFGLNFGDFTIPTITAAPASP